MDTLSVIHAVVNRLRECHPNMDVFISSAAPEEYIPTQRQVTVLIQYCGSVFATPESTDAIVQKQTLHMAATVIVAEISEAINTLDQIRHTLGGISLPGCDLPLWLDNEKYLGESGGFCRHNLEMVASTLFIADRESKDLPLLTIANYEEIQ
ncbi:hypothetical protein HV198_21635 [Citrobacter freundii]|uniref:Gp37 family protein n=1 Tax=Citrobacter freundii TaxID=546 RepID=UPI0015E4AAFE|nr:Gp37 family protein [Citrobacter freundii]QLO44600.1 hypothetical protein HV215_21630 [Citrobacter freundii]QLV42764.1 hypothetical protein HV198_21635 [Citrobacter freundii]